MADEIKLQDGKYVIRLDAAGLITAERHGEPWPAFDRDLRYSKVLLAMFHRILNFERGLHKIKIADYEDLEAFIQLLLDDEIKL